MFTFVKNIAMKDKIAYLMKSEGLTTTRLAEILEIQPSAVSHLVSGRNKPGYDLLQKILRRFPRVNPDWLLLDSEEPYRSESNPTAEDGEQGGAQLAEGAISTLTGGVGGEYGENQQSGANSQAGALGALKSISDQKKLGKSPKFVVVFYSDGSCENFDVKW